MLVGVTGCDGGRRPESARGAAGDTLRVIVRSEPIAFLPRQADPVALDREIAAGLAASLQRPLKLVLVDDYREMIERLVAGEADLIAASLTATSLRRERLDFSLPYLHADELLLLRTDEPRPQSVAELAGREVCVRESNSFAETLRELQQNVPSLEIRYLPEEWTLEEIVDRVAVGECWGTVIDSHYWQAFAGYYPNVHATLTLAEDRPIALALQKGHAALRRQVNEFLIATALTGPRDSVYTGDLPALKERRRLRMITRNTATTYFLHRGVELGFDYELMKRFAERNGMRLEIVIPPSRADLIPWLLDGQGDVIAAALTITPERAKKVSFTQPTLSEQEVVVVPEEEDNIAAPGDLTGRTVHVRAGSPAAGRLTALRDGGADFDIAFVPVEVELEEMLARVASGSWDAAVCRAGLWQVERAYGTPVRAAFVVRETELAWAVRPTDPELLSALNEYLDGEHRGLFYNTILSRYFRDERSIVRARDDWRSDLSGRISPYDELAKEYAAAYDLDWRLLVAQMFQESRFDSIRESWAGAVGLMQVLPKTANEMGTGDPADARNSVHGGAKYMRWLMDSFDPKLPLGTRIRFALASYNAGRSHVLDARRLAVLMGWTPDRWYGNVERAMLLLEKPEYYDRSRFGFVRGSETVRYVREVDRRYRTYVQQVPDLGETAGPSDDSEAKQVRAG